MNIQEIENELHRIEASTGYKAILYKALSERDDTVDILKKVEIYTKRDAELYSYLDTFI